jgi:hypothetical protein
VLPVLLAKKIPMRDMTFPLSDEMLRR